MITPSDSASSPADYAAVAPSGRGPAAYDIQADAGLDGVTAAFDEANRLNGQGVLYPQSERQAQAQALMQSPQGFAVGGYDIDAGSTFGWPGNVEPGG
jgi:hypothetical protein